MMISERIQALIHTLEVRGGRWLNYAALTLLVLGLGVWYDTHCYHNFSSPEAMDAAQVARNVANGKGFTTELIRPFSIYLLQKHNHAPAIGQISTTNTEDTAEVYGRHPDLANAPLYPMVLAGLFKVIKPEWMVEINKPFWSDGGGFHRYKPDFFIAIFNQILLLVAVLMTFVVAKTILDMQAAWLAALLMLFSDELWKFSVSGLPTLLLMVFFLGLVWCLVAFEIQGRVENPDARRRFALAVAAGILTGLGMLTRYSFGWVIMPLVIFFAMYGGQRRVALAAAAFLVFLATVSPWIVRNLAVSGTLLGTAGYAVMENSYMFPGSLLMQSSHPEMFEAYKRIGYLILVKLAVNLKVILGDELLRTGGGWVGILFLAGLLLGIRNVVARRLRYFTMMCLGIFVVATALGQTSLSDLSPGANTENLLVLLMPLAVIFGVAFFLTMLNQMSLPSVHIRYLVVGLVILLMRLQFMLTLLPPQNSPVAYPPYYPPDIQKFSAWMEPDELIMSDIPWAVAWYGNRQCVWTTINCKYEFHLLNDSIKPVKALYLSVNTLDERFLSECFQGGAVNSWGNFAYTVYTFRQLPNNFPLGECPVGTLRSGLFFTDHKRWQTE